jgi:cobalt-zinc-cadmium resistance protein CzcA
MIERLVEFSVRRRWLVLLVTMAVVGLGLYNFQRLAIDAVPDITNIQVQINTEAPGYSPLEAEQRITYPIETVMAGLPGLEYTRSLSRYGLSQVTVVFHDGTDIYFARQLVSQRLQEIKANLPPGVEPTMGPIATGLGEIFFYTVDAAPGAVKPDGSPYSAMDLRTVQDWIIRPQLRQVPGVVDINTAGGYTKQIHVRPRPDKLVAYRMTLTDVVDALGRDNANVGAGYIERGGEQLLVRSRAQVSGVEEIAHITLTNHRGVPVLVKDVADVAIGHELRTGAATKNGKEVVLGTAFLLVGENSRTVSVRVADKLREVNRTLPKGIVATPVYDRTYLVNATIATVQHNLTMGAVLVIVVLFLLLGNVRAAIITACAIPISMLFAITGMVTNHVSGNLLSLGAVDFGLIIDGAVVAIENCVRRLTDRQHELGRPLQPHERAHTVADAAKEVWRPTLFGQLIILIVYVPIFTLTGIEGKMFRPMAFTVAAALVGAMILSVTFIPAAAAAFLSRRMREHEPLPLRIARRLYRAALGSAMGNRAAVVTAAVVLIVVSALLVPRLGSEFLPTLDEGDVVLHALRIPGTSLSQAVRMQHQLEQRITEVPEVKEVFAKIGTADIATDPMPPSVADVYVMLKPRAEWADPRRPKEEVVRALEERLANVPGTKYEFTQPIEMRFNEMIAGVRSDVAVKVFGDDMDLLASTAGRIAAVLERIRGAADVRVEQVTGLPMLTITPDRRTMARYGVTVAEVQEAVGIGVGGKTAGQVFEGDRRIPIVVRLPEAFRENLDALKRLPIAVPVTDLSRPSGDGRATTEATRRSFIPVTALAEFSVAPGPNQISRENAKRVVIVTANVRGRDLGSFVAEGQRAISERVVVPAGYWTAWGGQFEHLISATRRLAIVVPITLLLIFVLLVVAFGGVRDAFLVFTGVPFALTGGVAALWLTGIPLSISAAVGFIALSGVAVLNGVVMVSFITRLREMGEPLDAAIIDGALVRLRPVLMTALVASLGFVPMAVATGTGAEVQRPLATVVIGGILSSTALTLVVLPVLYRLAHRGRRDVAARDAAVVEA